MYTLSAFDDSGCPTCGLSVAYRVSRECINCRKPQALHHSAPEYIVPQEFSSPEWDDWFTLKWESERHIWEAAEVREKQRQRDAERLARATKAAESFLPPEYRRGK